MPSRNRETSTADFAPSKMDFVNSPTRPFRMEKMTLPAMSRTQTVFIERSSDFLEVLSSTAAPTGRVILFFPCPM